MISEVVILAVLTRAFAFIDNSLVKRFFINLAKKTTFTKVDDWVAEVFYGEGACDRSPQETEKLLRDVQDRYDSLTEEQRQEAKGPSPRAWWNPADPFGLEDHIGTG